jgi:hypothetical protein
MSLRNRHRSLEPPLVLARRPKPTLSRGAVAVAVHGTDTEDLLTRNSNWSHVGSGLNPLGVVVGFGGNDWLNTTRAEACSRSHHARFDL